MGAGEIVDLLAFMVSPAAKWMTGTSVRMDGGEIKGINRDGLRAVDLEKTEQGPKLR